MYPKRFLKYNERNLAEMPRLDIDYVETLRREPDPQHSDIEASAALLRLIHDELEAYGTHGNPQLSEADMRVALRVLRSVMGRIPLEVALPFSDFGSFRSYWNGNGAHGSWQARRDILNEFFTPLHDELARLEDDEIVSTLVRPASSHPGTGWARVDSEINELRRHFQAARTEQDYRNVGNDCVAVTERLSDIVYRPDIHLRAGEEEPPVAKSKQRIGRFVDDAAPGSGNAEIRKLANAVIELAHLIKHRAAPTRRDSGIAADSVIQLANILRRLDDTSP